MSPFPTATRPATPRRRLDPAAPLVVAHRGASGYRPEHTLAAYHLAMEQGADYVEPDLVSTNDGVLVARHGSELSRTTDVAAHPAFSRRATTRVVNGVPIHGWFVEDFTLDEIKSLRARERMPRLRPRNRKYDGLFDIPTFDEVLDLVQRQGRVRGEVIGVCPELKRSSYSLSVGLDLERALAASLNDRHLNRPNARVIVQSFEPASLCRLRSLVRVPLLQLIGVRERRLATADVLAQVAGYADAIGVDKELLLTSRLVEEAHAVGMDVWAWTLRSENRFLPRDLRRGPVARRLGDATAEYLRFFEAGVDGVFTDHPDTAVAARHVWSGYSSGIRTHATM